MLKVKRTVVSFIRALNITVALWVFCVKTREHCKSFCTCDVWFVTKSFSTIKTDNILLTDPINSDIAPWVESRAFTLREGN